MGVRNNNKRKESTRIREVCSNCQFFFGQAGAFPLSRDSQAPPVAHPLTASCGGETRQRDHPGFRQTDSFGRIRVSLAGCEERNSE